MYEYFDFDVDNVIFEWDDEKEHINFVKVFLDPYKMIRDDDEHPEEERYDILGKVGRVLFVVCTFREGNTVRLISARIASASEKWRYEHGEDDYE